MKKYIFLAIFALATSVVVAQDIEKTINPYQFFMAHRKEMPIGKSFLAVIAAYDKDYTFTDETSLAYHEFAVINDPAALINDTQANVANGTYKPFDLVKGMYAIRTYMEGNATGKQLHNRGNYFLIQTPQGLYAIIVYRNIDSGAYGMYVVEQGDIAKFNELPLQKQKTFFKDLRIISNETPRA